MAMSQQSLPPVNQYTGSFTEDIEGDGVRLNAYGHEDADIGFDPLSANRRFTGTADLLQSSVGDRSPTYDVTRSPKFARGRRLIVTIYSQSQTET